MSSHVPSNEEYSILKFRLKYGLATRPNESNILAYAEEIWAQIDKSDILRHELYSKVKLKNALRGLTFNLTNFKNARIFKDSKKMKIIQQLRQNVAILKPDKGIGIVLLGNQDYIKLVEQLFKDQMKFEIFEKYPTISRMTTLQNYLRN